MATDKLVDFDHVTDYISREAAYKTLTEYYHHSSGVQHTVLREALNRVPTADVRTVSEIEKIIEILQEQADIYNARAKDLLVEEDGQVSQYTWAVSLRETYRRIIKTLDDLIS